MGRDVSITVRFTSDGDELTAHYSDAKAAAADEGLRCLFDDKLITACSIERGDKRLTGLAFLTWERYHKALEPYTNP